MEASRLSPLFVLFFLTAAASPFAKKDSDTDMFDRLISLFVNFSEENQTHPQTITLQEFSQNRKSKSHLPSATF